MRLKWSGFPKKDGLQGKNTTKMLEEITLEAGRELKRRAAERTPVVTGNLRGAWRVSNVSQIGNACTVWVENPAEYASHVEFGHRQEVGRYVPALGKRLKRQWVAGRGMLTVSAREVEERIPKMVEKHLNGGLNEVFR